MTKFKVGDKVKIREDLEVDVVYGGAIFMEDMKEYRGMVATIISIDYDGKFTIDLDNGKWFWTNKMFEGSKNTTTNKKESKSSSIKCTELIWVDNGVSQKLSAIKNSVELENKMINLAFVKFDGNSKVYVFLNPTDQILKKGTRVLVDTKYGEKQATVLTGIKLQEQYLDNLLEAIEATKPLKYVLGIVRVERFEVAA